MIIFGWRGRTSIEQNGLFNCPVCNAKTQYVVSRSRPWFTVFFIPIFPVGSGIRAMICASCGTILDPDFANQPPVILPPRFAGSTANPAHAGYPAPVQSRFSSLAIVSLVAGFLSPVFIILCFLSLITSTVAIVTGHIALYKIKRSANRLDGRAVAIVGLVLGYISLTLTIASLAFIFTRSPSKLGNNSIAGGQNTPQSRLDDAELSVVSGSKGNVGRGNSDLAKSLATEFSKQMKRADELVFTANRKPGVQLSGGQYITHCELHDDSCAFIVHVPSYRHFTTEAEKALADLAWAAASATVKNDLKDGGSLAIGLRGSFTYGDILIGTFANDSEKLDYRMGSATDLVPFFATNGKVRMDKVYLPSDLPVELPMETSTPSPLEPSPFEPSLKSDANSTDVVQPKPQLEGPVEMPSASPAPPSETLNVSSSPKPKRELPAFENKIPVSLLKSIDAQGWSIKSMMFIQNSNRLVTGGLDQKFSVFDVRSGVMLFRSERQEELGQVISLALSKDGQSVFAGGSTGRVASFEVTEDGKFEFVKLLYKHNREAACIVVSPKYPFVVSGGEDGTVAWQPYDERSSLLKTVQVLKRKVLAAHLFKDRNEGIATDGQTIIRFSLKDSEVLEELKLGKSYARAAAISPDGTRIAVSYGSDLKLFNTSSGEQDEKTLASSEMVWSVLFHPTRKWLITGGKGKAIIWDIESTERLAVLDAAITQYVTNLAVSADGTTLAIIPSSAGQSIKVFDLTK